MPQQSNSMLVTIRTETSWFDAAASFVFFVVPRPLPRLTPSDDLSWP